MMFPQSLRQLPKMVEPHQIALWRLAGDWAGGCRSWDGSVGAQQRREAKLKEQNAPRRKKAA
jgi:hypothetical protein